MVAPILYYMPESGPCRTVLLTARILNLKLDTKLINLMKGEHLTPEFQKLNPVHNVPMLVDGDFKLNESRVIMTYLVEQYGRNDTLYPKAAKPRATINQRLQFDIGTLYKPIVECYRVIYFGKPEDESQRPAIKSAFEVLESYLARSVYAAGPDLTVADITLVTTVTTAVAVLDYDLSPYPNITRWYKVLSSTLPGFEEIIEENNRKLRELVDSFRK